MLALEFAMIRAAAIAWAISVVLTPAVAVARDLAITAMPREGQELQYRNGRPVIISGGPRAAVSAVLLTERVEDRGLSLLLVARAVAATSPVNIGPADLRAATDAGPAKILTGGDMEAQAKSDVKRQVLAARLRGMGAALQGSSGSFEAQTTYSGRTAHTTGSYTPPLDSYAAVADARREIDAAQASAGERAASARSLGFNPFTLQPGEYGSTIVPISEIPRSAKEFALLVKVDGEVHTFMFDLGRTAK
ncbi:hypothetical protein [Phenylobacterium sp.]|uniref:hypothetical protein n=1 Tax=Phenylobacterium sp. TaxID=1871053 RepID=UPI00301CDCB9